MRTMLELINVGARTLAGIGGLAMLWAGAREMRRGHAHPDVTVGAVGAPGGLDAGGGARVWGSARQAVRRAVRRACGGYMAAERWLGARIPAWVGLPWLRVRRAVRRGRHYSAERARRVRGALAAQHHQGPSVEEVRRQLYRDAVRVLCDRSRMSRASVAWAEGVLS